MPFLDKLNASVKAGRIPQKISVLMQKFYKSYAEALQGIGIYKIAEEMFVQYLEIVEIQLVNPTFFDPFHESVRSPIDFYGFGLELFRPLIDFPNSYVFGTSNLDKIQQLIDQGDNVILLANHQTEPDPQVISLMLEKSHPKLATDMIFVAGHRVTTDPLAVPLSLGRNLLCIYSKRHMAYPPEKRQEKLLYNQRTMKKMGSLLSEGGKCIYVAPSGGRDRPTAEGVVEVAPFDSSSIEMFSLIAKQAEQPTHFFPFALSTFNLLPPPISIEKEIGERRHAQCAPVFLSFGEEIDMENFPGSEGLDRRQKRQVRADYIWNLVKQDYGRFKQG